jgi:SNF2 family DNA or RNA helicase
MLLLKGTGKTLQSIAFLAFRREQHLEGQEGFDLVICPRAVLDSWEAEFNR